MEKGECPHGYHFSCPICHKPAEYEAEGFSRGWDAGIAAERRNIESVQEERRAAVQTLVHKLQASPERTLYMRNGTEISFNEQIEALAAVWPEAVEE